KKKEAQAVVGEDDDEETEEDEEEVDVENAISKDNRARDSIQTKLDQTLSTKYVLMDTKVGQVNLG
ncbi:hypothetical protein U1Q18_016642, partial [Sarracenia purpurea var. burkii]